MGTIQDYQRLDVWQLGRDVALRTYVISRRFPSSERFGLADQIRRAATSVPANIAEGSARGSRREFSRFLRIARGSLAELHSHLCLATDLQYVDGRDSIFADVARLHCMLNALIGSLNRKNGTDPD